jgi:hypothetical protein
MKLTDAKWFKIFLCFNSNGTIFKSLFLKEVKQVEDSTAQGTTGCLKNPPNWISSANEILIDINY